MSLEMEWDLLYVCVCGGGGGAGRICFISMCTPYVFGIVFLFPLYMLEHASLLEGEPFPDNILLVLVS